MPDVFGSKFSESTTKYLYFGTFICTFFILINYGFYGVIHYQFCYVYIVDSITIGPQVLL